jgi:hypothetical protein
MICKAFNSDKIKNAKTYSEKVGFKNEKEAAYLIDFDFKNNESTAVMHDLRFEYNGRVAQIDHIIMNSHFIYVIESKFFSGEIEITENGNWIINYESDRIQIGSPIIQNKRHISVLEDIFKNETFILNGKKIPEIVNVVMLSNKTIIKGKLPPEVVYAEGFLKWSQDMRINILLTKPWKVFTIQHNNFDDKDLSEICTNLLKFDTLTKKDIVEEKVIEKKVETKSFFDSFKNPVTEITTEELFNQLKKVRLDLANKENVQAYLIFSNKVLEDMASIKPKTKEEMLKISGVGEVKYEKYGEILLREINS